MGNRPRLARLAPYLPLLLIAVGAFVFRLGLIELLREPCVDELQATEEGDCYRFGGDTEYVAIQADRLVAGDGFVDSTRTMFGIEPFDEPGAAHPPLFTIFLAGLQVIGFDSVGSWRVVVAAVGSLGVGLVGLAAWRLGGDREHTTGPDSRTLGIIAATLAALNPLLWTRDVDLLVEALLIPLIALVVIVSLRLWRQPTWDNAAWLGIVIGVAWSTRSEQILLLAGMAPLYFAALDRRSLRARIGLFAITAVVAGALMAPWVAYNYARFDRPLISTNVGTALVFGACDDTFYGPHFGHHTFHCFDDITTDPDDGEAVVDNARLVHGAGYIRDNWRRLPAVTAARFGHFWNVYEVPDTIEREALVEWHGWVPTRAGVATLYLLAPFAVVGAVQLRRRRVPLSPLLAPILVATLAATLLLPLLRFRTPADVTIVLLAAPGLLAAWRQLSSRVRLSARSGPEGGA